MPNIAEQLANAVRNHQAGRLAEAEALYRAVLADAPQQADALHLLGVLAHQQGRHAEALNLISQALAGPGANPVFHSNMASVYLAMGRWLEAEARSREAIRLKPDLADAHNNLGIALRQQARPVEAEAAFRNAVRLNSGHIDARSNLGAILERQGKLAEALTQLQEAIRLAPGHAQARNDLGGALIATGQPADAESHLQEAIRLRPNFAEAHNNLGVAQRDQNRIDAAIASFQEALRLNPGYPKARNNLGYVLEVQGKLAEAVAEFQEVVRTDPANGMALFSLSRLAAAGHCQFSAEQVRGAEELLARPATSREDLCRLHFALAWAYDKPGTYEQAFAHCRRANDLRKELDRHRTPPFDAAALHEFIDRLIATYTPAYFVGVRSFGLDSELPIFVIGMPRSGTTLAEQILASHPDVHGAGELTDLGQLVERLPKRLGVSEPYPDCAMGLDATHARDLGETYLANLRRLGGGAARVVDKMPFNFLHLGMIATLFPRARIIHCRRDPADTCLSCYFQNFGGGHAFALELTSLGQYYRQYDRLMLHWAQVLPMPIFELRYEELTSDQHVVSRRLIEFCGLPWDERCLRFNETERPVRTASVLEVRKPMYRSSVGRWKRYETQLQPLLAALASPAQ